MPKIFISYRREDSQWPVDRINAALKPYVADPKTDIFVDVDNIPVGVEWAAYLDSKVSQCDVLLAVIGPDWLSIKNPKTGQRRLDDPRDFVRIEIAAALKRNVPVAPVLLDGVQLPEADELPEELRPLLGRQGVEVSRMTFDADVQRLINGLGLRKASPLQHMAAATSSSRTGTEPKGSPAPMIALVLLLLAAGGIGTYGYTQGWFNRTAAAGDADPGAAPAAGTGEKAAAASVDPADTGAWTMASNLKSPEAYNSYLSSFPNGAHAGEARAALERMVDDADWTKAAGRGRAEVSAYLAAHPSGAHAAEARNQLANLDAAAAAAASAKSEAEKLEIERRAYEQREIDRKAAERKADDTAWAIANGAGTAAAYRAYIANYPSGNYVSSARGKISQLEKPSAFDLNQLNPDVRAAVEQARSAERQAQQRAADARNASTRADEAAVRARSGAAGTKAETYSDSRFECEMANGTRNGYGVWTTLAGDFNGDVYRGQWKDDKVTGVGVVVYGVNKMSNDYNRTRYEGEWLNDQRNGYGVFLWRDNDSYAGQYRNSMHSGPGVYRHADGRRREGDWASDKQNGLGVLWNADGTVYQSGRWKDGALVEAMSK